MKTHRTHAVQLEPSDGTIEGWLIIDWPVRNMGLIFVPDNACRFDGSALWVDMSALQAPPRAANCVSRATVRQWIERLAAIVGQPAE